MPGPVKIENEPTLEQVKAELAKYPKVRDSTSIVCEEESTPSRTTGFVQQRNTFNSNAGSTAVREGSQFWEAMSKQLDSVSSSPIIAESILQSIKEVHDKYIQSLSLDDVERLAISIQKYQQQQQQQQ